MAWLQGLNDQKLISELEQIARSHQQGDRYGEYHITPTKKEVALSKGDR